MLRVSRLAVTPVRSLALHHPDSVELTEHGVPDDRRYSLHTGDGRVFDRTKLGALGRLSASLEMDPERLAITLPSGEVVTGEVRLGEPMTAEIYGRRFSARRVIGPWGDAISAFAGRRLTLVRSERRPGERDRNPVSIVSDASVDELARQGNDGRPLDGRRFRMLVHVAGGEPHQEDTWIGRTVAIGPEVVVRVTRPDPRCVIITQDPDTGERDFPTLHAIKAYRGVRDGRHIDFGVYAEVVVPGRIAVGDEVAPGA